MINNIKFIIIVVLVTAIFSTIIYLLVDYNKKLITEVERLDSNQTALNGTVKLYLSKSGKQVATIEQLVYNLKEMKKYHKEDVEVIKDMGLKLKQVEAIIKTGIVTIIRDTIPLRDTIISGDTVSCFKKFDEYVQLLGCVRNDSVEIDLAHRDTIDNIAHWTYKKWFIFKFKSDTIRLESKNRSPYGSIYWNQYIKIKKK